MELIILNNKGQKTDKKITLDESIFNVTPNDHAIYLDVKQYLAHQRQGTHKSKERAEIAFSTKKIKKQKGTGGARAGEDRLHRRRPERAAEAVTDGVPAHSATADGVSGGNGCRAVVPREVRPPS
jgi:ribosomal protein L4